MKYSVQYNGQELHFNGVSPWNNPEENTLLFALDKYVEPGTDFKQEGCVVILTPEASKGVNLPDSCTLIPSESPKYTYALILRTALEALGHYERIKDLSRYEASNGSYVSTDNVSIGEGTVILPGCVIGPDVQIGKNCLINAGVRIVSNTKIGNNVVVGSNTVIGHEGFGFAEESPASRIRLPHLGGVIIHDDCEVGQLTTVVAGTIEPTQIGRNTKIDDHVHVGHNVKLDENCIITACAELSRSSIGKNVWVGPNAAVIQGVTIADDVFVGIGAVVTKSLEEKGMVYAGNPATEMEEYIRQRKGLKNLAERTKL